MLHPLDLDDSYNTMNFAMTFASAAYFCEVPDDHIIPFETLGAQRLLDFKIQALKMKQRILTVSSMYIHVHVMV